MSNYVIPDGHIKNTWKHESGLELCVYGQLETDRDGTSYYSVHTYVNDCDEGQDTYDMDGAEDLEDAMKQSTSILLIDVGNDPDRFLEA